MTRSHSRSRGLTIVDFCVLMAACVLLLAVAAPLLAQQSRETANRVKCASNLRQIALASIIYANQDTRSNGKFSRTYYDFNSGVVNSFTGIDAEKAFDKAMGPDFKGPKPNDVTASLFNVLKTAGDLTPELTPALFVCPSSDATPLPKTFDVKKKSNFPGTEHLAYSYNNPFGSKEAIQSGWKFDTTSDPTSPLAADMNPGVSKEGGPTNTGFAAPAAKMASANSPNHWFTGQNVVYVDGHVEWQTTPFAGAAPRNRPWRDNIYANMKGVDAKTGVGGEVNGLPQVFGDSVLLPSIQDLAEGAKRNLPVRDPAKAPK